jgi:hypothetical protein
MPTKTPKQTKPLLTDKAKRMITETVNNPKLSAGRLRWVHDLIGRAMIQHNIEPYAIERGRAVRRARP